MKKILLFTMAAVAAAGLSSCDNTNSATSTMTYNVSAFNLITSLDGSSSPMVSASYYKFNFDLMAATTTMATEMGTSNGNISFVTNSMKYSGGIYKGESDGQLHEVINIEEFKPANNIYNLKCMITTMGNVVPDNIAGLPSFVPPAQYKYLILDYQVGDNTQVRTFWNDIVFCGYTTTRYTNDSGINKQFSTNDIKYRVVMKPGDRKATVILYDAKFAEEMKMSVSNIVLENLPVTFTEGGYEIMATDVIPKVYTDGTGVPFNNYKFDNFTLVSNGDMTRAIIEYEVAGKYTGYFEGTYVNLPASSNE